MTEVSQPFLALRVHVPMACFRDAYAREYAQSYPFAPPSTVYGFLLSLVGEIDRLKHQSARIIVGRFNAPALSRVLRTNFRWKDVKEITSAKNRTPDWQEILTDIRVAIWLADGDSEPAAAQLGTLRQRVERALKDPSSVERFGGLSLGESSHMVDAIWPMEAYRERYEEDLDEELEILRPEQTGIYTLPVWPNHIGSAGTRWGAYEVFTPEESDRWTPSIEHWTEVMPPSMPEK